jgi:DNA-binding SARP family transcriptional activator/tetratricopeptide (TPR) repeat protein
MLEIRLLSEQRVTGSPDAEGRSSSSRSVALLAYLILHAGVPQARLQLAGIFWPDSSDAQARTNLRRELHNLREMLGGDPSLRVEPSTLTWRDCPLCRVDVRVFDSERLAAHCSRSAGDITGFLAHAEAAIAEYRGDLMPGSYDDWVLEEREPLLRACVDLCDGVIRALRDAGDRTRAAEVARRRIQLEPLEEVGYRFLMELQAESGDRAAAVRTYHRCATVLEQELGVSPHPETTAMVDQLLDRRDASEKPRESGGDRARPNRAAGAGLVGRGNEVDLLVGRWRQAAGGRSGLVVVSGEAGVGKSRLVSELAAIAGAQGAAVAATRCFGRTGRLALAPVADWLRSPDLRPGVAALDAVWQAEVDRLVPRSAPPSGRGAAGADQSPGDGSRAMVDTWQRHRFFEGLARAVLSADRPMLLVLDDLQWCDEETAALLAFVLGFAEEARLLVAATVRSDELEDNREVAASLRAMRSAGMVTDVSLAPLDTAGTRELAMSLLDRPLTDAEEVLLQGATGGYPLFVVEAARSLPDPTTLAQPLPASDLQAVLRRRLEQASPAARAVAGLGAAVGRDFSLDLLSEASDLDAETLVQAVDELWRRRILREQRSGYDFAHDLLRDAAYASVSPPHRWLLHRRLAQGIELLSAGHFDDVAAQLADQYDRGGRPDRAFGYFRRAAELASVVFANAEAIRHHRRCLDLIEQMPGGRDRDERELDVLQTMSEPVNAMYGYSSPVLQSTLERSAALAESLGRREVLLRNLVGLFTVRFVQGHIALAHELAGRALALAEADPDLAGEAHFAFAGSSMSLGLLAVATTHFDQAIDLSPVATSLIVGTRPEVHAQAWAAHAHWLLGHDDQASSRCADAVTRARASDHPYTLAMALGYAAITHQLRDDRASLGHAVVELRDLCQRYEFAYYGEWALILEGWAAGGDHGVSQIREGISRLRSQGANARMPYWMSLLAEALVGEGRREEACTVLDAALVAAEQREDNWWLPEVIRLRAGLDPGPGASEQLRRAIDLASGQCSWTLEARCRADLAGRSVRSPSRGPNGEANAERTLRP